jgi:hypothetical protein
MPRPDRLRVAVAIDPRARQDWHAVVVDALRAADAVATVTVIADRASHAPGGDAWDVVIDLAGAGCALEPTYGVWRYGFGDGAPVAHGAAGTRARLYRTTGDPARGVVLHEGWYRARTAAAWGTRSVGQCVAPWCARVVRQIAMGDSGVATGSAQPIDGCSDPQPPDRAAPFAASAIDTVRSWMTRQRWTVGVVPVGIETVLQQGYLPEPAWIAGQPADCFFADPFVIGAGPDRTRILAEEYRYATRAKTIVELHVSASGELVDLRRCPGLPPDASYPFVLREGGRTFCLPETFRAQRLDAFAAGDGAAGWTFARTLLDRFPCVDGTLLLRDGLWWLFCTKQGDEDQTDLHLFFATDWIGSWTPHPLNPVKSDTRSSRPAGACFEMDGALYRPAQNCARHYGAAITINRVTALSVTAFREEPVLTLRPGAEWAWPEGLHTINSAKGVTVVDGLRLERRWGPAALVRSRRAASR